MRNASSPHSVKMIGSEQKIEQERYSTFNISSIKRVTRKFLEAPLYSCKTRAKKCTKNAQLGWANLRSGRQQHLGTFIFKY